MAPRRRLAPLGLSFCLALSPLAACKKQEGADTGQAAATGQANAPVEAIPDEGPLPELRTGPSQVEEHPAVEVQLSHRYAARGAERADYFEFEMTGPDIGASSRRVHIVGHPEIMAVAYPDGGNWTVTMRRDGTLGVPDSLSGVVYGVQGYGHERKAHGWHFKLATGGGGAEDAELPERFAQHFPFSAGSGSFEFGWARQHPWASFASARLASRGASEAEITAMLETGHSFGRGGTDLSRLMDTTTAALSLQEALQHERGLRMRRGAPERTIDIGELQGPPLKQHPFEAMRAALPDPKAGVAEPMAALVPADFWYLRFSDIRLLLRTLDEADAWLTPVIQILQENSENQELTRRYQAQLGVRRSDLARAFGNTVVARIALVGSDPYLREGSDLTLIFEAKEMGVLRTELERQLESWKAEVPGVEASSFRVREHEVAVFRDPTGAVRRHQVEVGSHFIVSNSRGAITRVLDAIDAKTPRLGDEPDLAFMLARDPVESDALAFMSDAFIAAVISPQQKLLEARRQLAYADLLVPGYAALLHGWLEGSAPESVEAMIAAGYLRQDELSHAGGEAISFAPGQAARSSWGSVGALTPLIDLEPATKVSEAEKLAYEDFARGYQQNWTTFIDPVAVRLDLASEGESTRASVSVRVLPLIANSEYSDIREVVGEQRVEVPEVRDGLQVVWAVGKDTRLRRELNQLAKSFSGDGKIGIDWLGDWVAIGALDRKAILEVAWYELETVQRPAAEAKDEDEDVRMARRIGALPIFAIADTSNPAGVAATLAGLKALVNSAAPGMLAWGEDSRHREVPIVRIAASATATDPEVKALADAISLYYANAGGKLIFALREDVMHTLIDRALDGRMPEGLDGDTKTGPQFVVAGTSEPGRALWTAIAWSLQAGANSTQALPRQAAEILLRGDLRTQNDPEAFAALGRAYFGAVPTTASGKQDWTLTPLGPSDPEFGTALAPSYPALPVAGSPIERLMQRLTGLRGEVGFEREAGSGEAGGEPGLSLATRFELTMGPETNAATP